MLEQPLLSTDGPGIQNTSLKLLPQKNSYSKIVFCTAINFISWIYSSSKSSEPTASLEEISKSSIKYLTTFFSICLHSFKKTCR